MKNIEEKQIKVLMGSVGVEFSKNGIFATLRAVQVNPQENIEAQIEKYIENDSTLRGMGYEWTIQGEIHKYYADTKASEEGIRQLRDRGYIVEDMAEVRNRFIDDLNRMLKENFDYVPIFKVVNIADGLVEKGWKFDKDIK